MADASGTEIIEKDLAEMIARLTGFVGQVLFDATKPNARSVPRHTLRVDTIRTMERFEFEAEVSFEKGLKHTITW